MKKRSSAKGYTHQSSLKSNKQFYSHTDRVMNNVPYPPVHLLTIREIFGTSS